MTFIERSRRLGPAVSLAVILLACSDPAPDTAPDPSFVWANPPSCDSNAAAVSLLAAQRDSMPGLRPITAGYRTIDELYYQLAERIPGGWAAWYKTPLNGRLTPVLMFVDTSDVLAALDSLAKYYRSFSRDSIVLRQVRWDWVQLDDWYRYITWLHGLPDGETSSDIDEVTNRLEFGSVSEGRRQAILGRLRELHVPCWLAAVNIEGYAVLKGPQPPPAASGVVAP